MGLYIHSPIRLQGQCLIRAEGQIHLYLTLPLNALEVRYLLGTGTTSNLARTERPKVCIAPLRQNRVKDKKMAVYCPRRTSCVSNVVPDSVVASRSFLISTGVHPDSCLIDARKHLSSFTQPRKSPFFADNVMRTEIHFRLLQRKQCLVQ
jgi:hypothetical protein